MEETTSREIYEDTHSLLREMLREMSTKVDAGLSFKFEPTEESMAEGSPSSAVSVGQEYEYEKKKMIKDVSEYTTIKVNVSQ